jgi:hypothetical protein
MRSLDDAENLSGNAGFYMESEDGKASASPNTAYSAAPKSDPLIARKTPPFARFPRPRRISEPAF